MESLFLFSESALIQKIKHNVQEKKEELLRDLNPEMELQHMGSSVVNQHNQNTDPTGNYNKLDDEEFAYNGRESGANSSNANARRLEEEFKLFKK